jgi:hypothetical protein
MTTNSALTQLIVYLRLRNFIAYYMDVSESEHNQTEGSVVDIGACLFDKSIITKKVYIH